MKYRLDRYGNKISQLGFGCMRFTSTAGRINIDKAEKEIMLAYKKGVNYFDTAYVYGGSEACIGEIFERNGIREKINIATKLPYYMIKSKEGCEKKFREQLTRLRTSYVDYYLMHMLNDVATWEKLCALGIDKWIEERKAAGEIKQIGFSYHGNSDTFCKILDAYDWDFCQIQYNYMDVNSQAGVTGLKYAASKGIPVIIMEPLRGGRLVNNLPEKAKKIFDSYEPKNSPAEWAFKWLWNQPEVTCVLSGMNSQKMVLNNCKNANHTNVGDLTEKDQRMLDRVVKAINAKTKVGCTGCRYCMPCPRGVDIPGTFAAYNHYYTDNPIMGLREYLMCTALRKDKTAASLCVECGLCEKHCPQNIPIREELKNARKKLEGIPYKAVRKGVEILKIF